MPVLRFKAENFTIEQGESVLDCLTRNEKSIPFSCKSGSCQTCMIKVLEGKAPEESQKGLKSTYKAKGFALACRLKPTQDLSIDLPSVVESTVPTKITDVEKLTHNVVALRLKPLDRFTCIPGQYLTLINPHNVSRCYSIANQPEEDGFIELHIRHIPDGQMSGWVANEARAGMVMHIRGPAGSCFYAKEDSNEFPIVLAGTGTGLAPLYGILVDAIRNNHRGKIELYHGARSSEDLYYSHKLIEIAKGHNNVTYAPCVLNNGGSNYLTGNIQDIVLENLPQEKDLHVYLCGSPEFVQSLRKKTFLAGIASKNIFADAFTPSTN